MLFHVRMVDYPVSRRTAELRERHQRYVEEGAARLVAHGVTSDDEGSRLRATLFFLDLENLEAVQRFIADEPYNRAGVFMHVETFRWGNPLGRRQSEFHLREGLVPWYLRGYGRPGAHREREGLFTAHQAYFKPYDDAQFIARGGVQDEGGVWVGSANLIALPDRAAADAFAAAEPFCKNGLFERMLIERYRFGVG